MKKNKYYKLLSNISIYLSIAIIIFTSELNNLDELWNFSNAINFANGLIPYKEFNMITTPLYAIINGIILKIFGKHLYIYRISYILLYIFLTHILSKILKKINIPDLKRQIFLIITIYLLLIFTYSDYNFFNLILLLLIINLEIKKEKTVKENILIGTLLGLSTLTKQTTGIITSAASIMTLILYKIIYKEKIYNQIKGRIIGMITILTIFYIYLLTNHITNDFIDLTILGLKGFNSKLSNKCLIILIISILYIISIIIKEYKHKNKINYINIILIVYSSFYLIINYPILDPIHLIISLIPCSILFIYNHKFKLKVQKELILLGIIITINIINIKSTQIYIKSPKLNEYNVYKFIRLNIGNKRNIINVSEFVKKQDKETYILDNSSIAYMLPLNNYHHYFDIPLAGNVGTHGETIMLNKIKEKDCNLLIKDRQNLEKSFPTLYKYIMENYQITETENSFGIYKKL